MQTEVHKTIELCETAPFIVGENGHFAVTDGCFVWTVIVTKEAMAATSSRLEPPLRRLNHFIRLYRMMAAEAISSGEVHNGKVWIVAKNVREFRPTHRRRSIRRVARLSSISFAGSGSPSHGIAG